MEEKSRLRSFEIAFEDLWRELFTSPVHLDSALSKKTKSLKSVLAQIVPQILRQPASLGEKLGVGIPSGEPWSRRDRLDSWRPAALIADRLYQSMQGTPIEVPAVDEDFPPEMIEEWRQDWGATSASELAKSLSKSPPLTLRARRNIGSSGLIKELKAEKVYSVRIKAGDYSPMAVQFDGYVPVLGTQAYESGAFEIQDEGSQLMTLFALWPEVFGKLLTSRPGSPAKGLKDLKDLPALPDFNPASFQVVDACAGAGGKSLALADLMKGKGRIFAYDISETKLKALRRRATHAGLNNIQAVALPEGEEQAKISSFSRSADLVLVDAPCSGWGVLRRNPDIKWRQKSDVLKRMPEVQLRLLELYSQLVKPKGKLVFGVCTFRKSETLDIVHAFESKNPEFKTLHGGFFGPSSMDGFFMHAFERIGD